MSPDLRPFLIDTDAGSDDAVALIMALNCPEIKVEAITVVAGNVPIDQAVQNALYVVELGEKPIPVYKGSSKPLVQELSTAQHVHGKDGLGDIGLELQGRIPAQGNAVDVIVDTAAQFAGELTVVTLGPLTNVASALKKRPAISQEIKKCVIMGGTGDGHGNITAVAEYNIWADPEAAQIVFESGIVITMVGWDVSRKYACINSREMSRIRNLSRLGAFSMDIQKALIEFTSEITHLDGIDLPDPMAMAIAIRPEISQSRKSFYVQVETGNGLCRGQTVVDWLGVYGQPPNVEIIMEANQANFLGFLEDTLRV